MFAATTASPSEEQVISETLFIRAASPHNGPVFPLYLSTSDMARCSRHFAIVRLERADGCIRCHRTGDAMSRIRKAGFKARCIIPLVGHDGTADDPELLSSQRIGGRLPPRISLPPAIITNEMPCIVFSAAHEC